MNIIVNSILTLTFIYSCGGIPYMLSMFEKYTFEQLMYRWLFWPYFIIKDLNNYD